MKRKKFIDRVRLIAEKQVAMEEAALEFATATAPYPRMEARRKLLVASADYGITVHRYLGGRLDA